MRVLVSTWGYHLPDHAASFDCPFSQQTFDAHNLQHALSASCRADACVLSTISPKVYLRKACRRLGGQWQSQCHFVGLWSIQPGWYRSGYEEMYGTPPTHVIRLLRSTSPRKHILCIVHGCCCCDVYERMAHCIDINDKRLFRSENVFKFEI